jgi:hypothetical protein
MGVHRRQFVRLAAGVAMGAKAPAAWAQRYPARPVRLIVGPPTGSAPDFVAPLLAQWLAQRLGQPFIVDNWPGAATNIATGAVARAAPDGYTLLLVLADNAINASFYEHLDFNFITDIVPVSRGHADCYNGQSGSAGQDRPRVHRICEGKAGQTQPGVSRDRQRQSSLRRALRDADRPQARSCAISRQPISRSAR